MESVVLLDEAGHPRGTADKVAVHHAQTPLHLAFSCYLFNEAGQFLLTRRAESKRTFPGVWTNTCCGHPLPGEPMSGSVLRRLREELGIGAAKLTLVLPRFRYQARMTNGVLENEVCPVYAAYTDAPPDPDPAEVAAAKWVDWNEFCQAVRAAGNPSRRGAPCSWPSSPPSARSRWTGSRPKRPICRPPPWAKCPHLLARGFPQARSIVNTPSTGLSTPVCSGRG